MMFIIMVNNYNDYNMQLLVGAIIYGYDLMSMGG